MANEEQLEILKEGVRAWNKWRRENTDVKIDLIETNFSGTHLVQVNLSKADLTRANLIGANLQAANLVGATLHRANLLEAILIRKVTLYGGKRRKFTSADLSQADLSHGDLRQADLSHAILFQADLRHASLRGAKLTATHLSNANLSQADLSEANLRETELIGTNFIDAKFGNTILETLDLSKAIGLEKVVHDGPSTIGTNTLAKSKGAISEVFLRGCGLSDWEIEMVKLYNPELSNEERNRVLYRIYDLLWWIRLFRVENGSV